MLHETIMQPACIALIHATRPRTATITAGVQPAGPRGEHVRAPAARRQRHQPQDVQRDRREHGLQPVCVGATSLRACLSCRCKQPCTLACVVADTAAWPVLCCTASLPSICTAGMPAVVMFAMYGLVTWFGGLEVTSCRWARGSWSPAARLACQTSEDCQRSLCMRLSVHAVPVA